MPHYPAVIHKEAASQFGVSFPDFPGCIAAGETLEDAHRNAIEALRFHVEGLEDDGEDLPSPSALEEIDADGGALALVPLLLPQGRARRVNISIDARILDAVDTEASRRGQTRSAFLAEAAERAISD